MILEVVTTLISQRLRDHFETDENDNTYIIMYYKDITFWFRKCFVTGNLIWPFTECYCKLYKAVNRPKKIKWISNEGYTFLLLKQE